MAVTSTSESSEFCGEGEYGKRGLGLEVCGGGEGGGCGLGRGRDRASKGDRAVVVANEVWMDSR